MLQEGLKEKWKKRKGKEDCLLLKERGLLRADKNEKTRKLERNIKRRHTHTHAQTDSDRGDREGEGKREIAICNAKGRQQEDHLCICRWLYAVCRHSSTCIHTF